MFLIIGSSGQLGSELKKFYSKTDAIFSTFKDIDISNFSNIVEFGKSRNIKGIINCAAYTNVDEAETDKLECEKVNIDGVRNLVKFANIREIPIIHISTDYVFDGCSNSKYKEDDKTNPLSVYGSSKLESEKIFMELANSGAIIRTSWLYSEFGNNFVKTILRLSKDKDSLSIISDQIGSPTYANDLARIIYCMMPEINNYHPEIYHFSNEGVASWYDFACEIVSQLKIDIPVIPIYTKDYHAAAVRPKYSVLDKSKIKAKFNIENYHWKESLGRCLKRL